MKAMYNPDDWYKPRRGLTRRKTANMITDAEREAVITAFTASKENSVRAIAAATGITYSRV